VSAEAIKSSVKVCMFDQYGTVVDMQGGLVAVAASFLKAKGWRGDPNAFVTWWRRTHFENSMIDALLHREHTPYRVIGERAEVKLQPALRRPRIIRAGNQVAVDRPCRGSRKRIEQRAGVAAAQPEENRKIFRRSGPVAHREHQPFGFRR